VINQLKNWKEFLASAFLIVLAFFFNLPNPSNRNVALGLTKPLTEISITSLHGAKARPELKADNLTASCELIV
jgi:hypothetical protein